MCNSKTSYLIRFGSILTLRSPDDETRYRRRCIYAYILTPRSTSGRINLDTVIDEVITCHIPLKRIVPVKYWNKFRKIRTLLLTRGLESRWTGWNTENLTRRDRICVSWDKIIPWLTWLKKKEIRSRSMYVESFFFSQVRQLIHILYDKSSSANHSQNTMSLTSCEPYYYYCATLLY